ncbi:MAG: DUF5018 domain-containing protein [Bacteroidales bacterium]|jgi:hypothetical protein|nr:DUF5018 domain-containing protein [Bacteroidales bacterium]
MKTLKLCKTGLICLLTAVMFSFVSCKDDDDETPKSSEKEISNFVLTAGGETFLGVVQEDKKTINFLVGLDFDQEYLKTATPTFEVSKGALADPASGKSQDFTKDVVYKVTAEDGSIKEWTVKKVVGTSSENSFTDFALKVGEVTLQGEIDAVNSTVWFTPTQDIWDLLPTAVPTFTLSLGATANPASGVAQDFSGEVTYTVTAHDGTAKEWTVKRTNRSGNEISYFEFKIGEGDDQVTVTGEIQEDGETVIFSLPLMGTDFTPSMLNVAPTILEISPGATVSPAHDAAQNFAQDVTYTVTAENGDQKTWTIKSEGYYVKQKWLSAGAAINLTVNETSVASIGDYLALGRTQMLLDKETGNVASAQLNVEGFATLNSNNPPFFVANDDAGNLVGCSFTSWSSSKIYFFKWTSATTAPTQILEFDATGLAFGRKFSVIGDVNGNGCIIAAEITQYANGVHYLWKITGGVVNPTPSIITTHAESNNLAYQTLTPINLTDNAPYYLGTTNTNIGAANEKYVNIQYNNGTDFTEIRGPYTQNDGPWAARGWGNMGFYYQKLFSLNNKNFMAVLHGQWANYLMTIVERNADGTHSFPIKAQFPRTVENTNNTGSLTVESSGDNIFIYAIGTREAVVCYQMSKL